MATRTISVLGGNWNDVAAWTEAQVPTAADDVVATALSGGLVVTASSVCRSIVLTGYLGTLSGSGDLTVGDAAGGGFVLASGMGRTYTGAITFASTTTGNIVNTVGKTLASALTFDGVGGGWTIQTSALVTTGTITLTNGALTASVNVTAAAFAGSNSNTRRLTLGAGIWALTGTGTVWTLATATGLTLLQGTSTIRISDTSGVNKTFAGGGQTYYNLDIPTGGAGIVILTGANVFNALTITAPKAVRFPASVTTTIKTSPGWVGSVGNVITIDSSTGGTPATLNIIGETDVICDYLSLQDSAGAGNIPFFAGANSTNVSGNTNWTFTAGPTDAFGVAGPHVFTGVGVINPWFVTGVSGSYGVSQRMN